jgi:ribulose 1,5-bisphosphate synthetase/thiazole synthase
VMTPAPPRRNRGRNHDDREYQTMPTSPSNVIIIGAGTGGLCLAQDLKRAGIGVGVYERDRTRRNGLQGYRVGIDSRRVRRS